MTDVQLYCGDCLDVLPTLAAGSVDSVICDPPYGLSFMGKAWDHGVPGVPFWEAALRVAKPGATLLAFGGTRTHHRLMVAIEDAGWEVRDVIMWLYGSGFPKSMDISKAIDKAAGAERAVIGEKVSPDGVPYSARKKTFQTNGSHEGYRRPSDDNNPRTELTAPVTPAAATWDGWGTALKPAWEPVIVAMKPLDGTFAQNALRHGVAGINVDGCRVATASGDYSHPGGHPGGAEPGNGGTMGNGWHSRMTQRPPHVAGRWPSNVILDDEAAAALDAMSGESKSTSAVGVRRHGRSGGIMGAVGSLRDGRPEGHNDTGGASRFFYCAKASRAEREAGLEGMPERLAMRYGEKSQGPLPQQTPSLPTPQRNHHPTVKPLALMRYLCKLTATPTGGIVLDPFMGSGSTGVAAKLEGRSFVGIELDPGYFEIAQRRIEAAQMQQRLPLAAD